MGNEEVKNIFGVDDKEMEAYKDFNPALKIEVDKTYKLRILSEKPRTFDIEPTEAEVKLAEKQGKKIEKRIGRVIEVENLDTEEVMDLWITPQTLNVRIAKLYAKHGTLKNIYIKVGKKMIEHQVYGEIPCYWVKEIDAEDIQSEVAPKG